MANESNEQPDLVILRDGEGRYYALPRPLLERARVPDEEQAAIDELASGDTAGFFGGYSYEARGVLPYSGYSHLPGVTRLAVQFAVASGPWGTQSFDERSF